MWRTQRFPPGSSLFSNLAPLLTQLSINHFPWKEMNVRLTVPSYVEIDNFIFTVTWWHHNALSAAIEQPALPQGREAKRNKGLIHEFTSKFYSQQTVVFHPTTILSLWRQPCWSANGVLPINGRLGKWVVWERRICIIQNVDKSCFK